MSPDPDRRLILGLMTFGPDVANGGRITSLDEFNKCLDLFQQRGYDELDTARLYIGGKQEAFTAATKWKERGFKLATKWYPAFAGAFKAQTLKAKVEESLRELKTDCVDIFYLHAADRTVPFPETLEAMDELYKQGKFKGRVRPTIFQAVYNVITRNIETELIPACRRYGLDIVIFNPLGGGILSGKFKTAEQPKEGRYSGDRMGAFYRARYFKDSTFEALRHIETAISKHGLTMAETAMRWCIHHSALEVIGGRDGVILGASSYEQLESNLSDFEKGPLPDEVVNALDEAWMIAKADVADYWHGELKYGYDTKEALFVSAN